MANKPDPRIEATIHWFNTLYLRGIPPMITDESAFLSFVAVLSATEALAGYRYARTIRRDGRRFRTFIQQYFPAEYAPHLDRLWLFRCRMIHGFSPAGFFLTHNNSAHHFRTGSNGNPILNAQDFYSAMSRAAEMFFGEVRTDANIQALMIARLEDRKYGGPIGVGPIQLAPRTTTACKAAMARWDDSTRLLAVHFSLL